MSQTQKPRSIQLAAGLMWAAVALELSMGLMGYDEPEQEPAWRWVNVLLSLAFTGVAALATVFFAKGRKWARLALLVLFILGVAGTALVFDHLVADRNLDACLSIAQLLLQAAALAIAYSAPGRAYFRSSAGDDRAMRAILPVGRSGWAIAAGYLALFSVLLVPAPFALACGLLAIRDIRRDSGKHGMGRAVFGVILGALGTAVMVFLVWRKLSG